MRFRVRCNLKTAPNIGEVSLVSVISPLHEWNVPVLPMASRWSRAPQTSGLYALSPPSDTPGYIYIYIYTVQIVDLMGFL